MKQCAFWCTLLLGITIFSSKGWCHPSNSPENDYIGDEEEGDYDENYNEKPYNGPPPVMKSKSATFTSRVGETVQLPCNVENGKDFVLMWLNTTTPNASLYMFIDNMRQMGKEDRVHKLENNSIELQNLTIYDSGLYMCKLISTPEQVITHTLVVKPPLLQNTKPTITMFKPNKEVSVRKGESLSLRCEAEGNPEPKITWSKNDNKNNEAKMQEDGTSLTIDSVSRKNSGIYTCSAQNSLGTDSKSVTVHVHYAPEIELEEDFVTTGDEVSVNLICTVHATPRPKVTWLKNGEALPPTSNMVNERNKYTLQLPKVKPEDFGEYTCEASNKEGRSEEIKSLSGKPKKPMLQMTKDASDVKKPQMVWKIQSFAPITDYEVLYKTRQDKDWKSAKHDLSDEQKNTFVYSIKHAFDDIPSAEYETKLRAKNRYGWSEISDIHFFTKDEEGVLSESGLLESSDRSSASELRISAVFVTCLFIARLYC